MIEQPLIDIVEKLIDGTKSKKIKWERTQRDTEFKVVLGSSSVTTDNWTLNNGVKCVDLTLWNSNGEIAKRIAFEDNDKESEDYNYLMGLYSIVQNAYYQVDDTIAEILKYLN